MYRSRDSQRSRIKEIISDLVPPAGIQNRLARLDTVQTRLSTLEHNLKVFQESIDRKSRAIRDATILLETKACQSQISGLQGEGAVAAAGLDGMVMLEQCQCRSIGVCHGKAIEQKLRAVEQTIQESDNSYNDATDALMSHVGNKLAQLSRDLAQESTVRQADDKLNSQKLYALVEQIGKLTSSEKQGRVEFQSSLVQDLQAITTQLNRQLIAEQAERGDQQDQITNMLEIGLTKFKATTRQ